MPSESKYGPVHSGWPDSSSLSSSPSTSLSSSFSSSAASHMPSQDSSQSEIHIPDHSAPPPTHPHVRNLALTPSRPRSSSLAAMGQNFSGAPPPASPTTPPSQLHKGIAVATATGMKLKRAFGGRRKNKSEDASKLFSAQGKDYYTDSELVTPVSAASTSREVKRHDHIWGKGTKMTLQLAQQVFHGARKSSEQRSPAQPSHTPPRTPPPPPPKPVAMQAAKVPSPPSPLHIPRPDPRASIIAVSPGISSALNYMRLGDQDKEQEKTSMHKPDSSDREKGEQKEAWRKSDSTMSHHTIRPGVTAGTRASRPVSMAESLQSIHTIVPVNKRLSALIADADFATPEEEPSSTTPSFHELVTPPKSSPTNSLKARNRRSMSLNLGPTFAKIYVPPSSATATTVSDAKYSSKSFDETHPRLPPSVSQETPTLTRAAANGIISPSSAGLQSTGNNIRGRLAAWSATNTANPSQRSLPPPPPRHSPANSSPSRHSPTPPSSSRQPTVSMTGGFGLAKRAVEKMNRAWGGFSSGSSNSGYSSSSSTAPSSYSDHNLARISSNQSGLGRNGKKSRRTPDAPSGAWSVNSANSSISDSDAFMTPSGPYLGKQLRGPMRTKGGGGGAVGGIVFGRDLKSVTRETAVGVGVQFSAADLDKVLGPDRAGLVDKDHLQMLERRMLPAIVVRCAQHLLLWGIQEEGLFRYVKAILTANCSQFGVQCLWSSFACEQIACRF